MLFRNGLNAKQVQVWLGHHSPAFTLATYVHLLADDLPDPHFLDQLTGGNKGATSPTENGRNGQPAETTKSLHLRKKPKAAEVQASSS